MVKTKKARKLHVYAHAGSVVKLQIEVLPKINRLGKKNKVVIPSSLRADYCDSGDPH